MSHLSKVTSKLSTLDAARAIYFIVVGLAIKQSLGLFSHDWPPSSVKTPFTWWSWSDRSLIGIGYLSTALRFTHGVSLLYAFEKDRIEKSTLPSATRVFSLAVFLTSMAIFLFLMADNLSSNFRTYLIFTALLIIVDLLYILFSGVIKKPFKFIVRWKQTEAGTSPRAALQWIASDLGILLFAGVLFWSDHHERLFALALIAAAIADYGMNLKYYFGGIRDGRKQKIVFVCSPLKGIDDGSPIENRLRDNIRKVQWYCRSLMQQHRMFSRDVIPFASHCFFTYFLDDHDQRDRLIGRECALAFLSACDAIYVYIPFQEKNFLRFLTRRTPKLDAMSEGMKHELDISKKLGLEIKFFPQVENSTLPQTWQPQWKYLSYVEENQKSSSKKVILENTKTRKRVFVCTPLRGSGFEIATDDQKRAQLKENIRAALWRCHELVNTDELIAPFAPQAFYPYFWEMLDDDGNEGEEWKAWFERSLEILKICDAVYLYTQDGLPNDSELSIGMQRIKDLADRLGIEIQYRKASNVPATWQPTTPAFEKILFN